MTERRQALFPGKSAATLLFLAVIPASFLLSVLLDTRQALGWTAPLALLLLSTAALILGLYGRRDSTSPRRIGRRI
jgi:hypothetical protein